MAGFDLGKGYYLWDFEHLPAEPGMYSWHLVHSASGRGSIQDYYNFFKSKKLTVEVKSTLKEIYQGTISATRAMDQAKMHDVDESLFERVSVIFAPSIYIGITKSQTLRERLNQHKKEILNLLGGGSSVRNHFANRIEGIIRVDAKSLSERNFFVRVIPIQAGQKDLIRSVETFANRTFHPQLGIK